MKRYSVLTRLILILSLGFVSLLHADDHVRKSSRYAADGTAVPGQYKLFWDFLKKNDKGFETIVNDKTSSIDAAKVADLTKAFEVTKKFRTGLDACVEKATEESDKSRTSDKFTTFVDDFQKWLTALLAKTDEYGTPIFTDTDSEKTGTQIKLSEKKILAYVAAIHEYLEAKGKKFTKLEEASDGDTKFKDAVLGMAKVLLGKEIVLGNGKIGGLEIAALKSEPDTKKIFDDIKPAVDALVDAKTACVIKWEDAAKGTSSDKTEPKTAETKPPGSPLGGGAAVDPTKPGPTGPGAQPGTGPGTGPTSTGSVNADAEAQRIAAEQDAIRAAEEARRRLLRELDEDDQDQEDIDKLAQLARLVQPQGNRSSDNDRSSQGPQFSPTVSPSSPGGQPQQFQPPQMQGPVPQDSGIAQLLPMLLNQNRGNSDLSPELLRAVARNNSPEDRYVPPTVPQANTSQNALLETLRMWQMQMMMNQGQVASRPNIYGGSPVGRATSRRGRGGAFASVSGRAGQISVSGARARVPSPLTRAAR